MLEGDTSGNLQPPIELSTNALMRVTEVSSIQLVGKIMGKEVGFLLDMGTTHNFIDPSTVTCLGLKLTAVSGFKVEVTDGEKMKGGECCYNTNIHIQDFESQTDLLVVPLGDAQIIMGMVWLKSLSPTLWDFSKRTLKFC